MKRKFSKKQGCLIAVVVFVVLIIAMGRGGSDKKEYNANLKECVIFAGKVANQNQKLSNAAGDAFNKSLYEGKDIHGNNCNDAFKAVAIFAEDNKENIEGIQVRIDSLKAKFNDLGETPKGYESIHDELAELISSITTHGIQVRHCILKTAESAGVPSDVVRIYPDVADRLYLDIENKYQAFMNKHFKKKN